MKELLNFNEEDWKMAIKLPNAPIYDQESAKVLLLRAILVYPRLMIEIANKNEYAKQFMNYPGF